jgi:hypothetical protein
MAIFDGIGTAVEGGLWARAMDPGPDRKGRHAGDPEECPNCGTALVGGFCHACGQSAHIHRSIGGFLHDLAHGALHFEGRFWRTLPVLVFRPGRLTRLYIDGARARFVSPMALFLFSVFLMFAVFQVLGIAPSTDFNAENVTGGMNRAREQAIEARTMAQMKLDALPDEKAEERAEMQAEITALDTAIQAIGNQESYSFTTADGDRVEQRIGSTGMPLVDKLVAKWRHNPGLMIYKLQANGYKFSWLLIPLSVPFVWLLFFWKRRFAAYDHAIFVTYSLSFMTLLFVALSLLSALGMGAQYLLLAIAVIAPVHLYKQLRHAYRLNRFSALWRLIALIAFIWVVVALFAYLLLMLGAF